MKFNLIDTLKGITTGIYNSIIINEQIEEMAEERLAICRRCPFNSEVAKANGQNILRKDEHCLKCGCVLKLKTRYPAAQCPLDIPKWKALVTNEESEKIMDLLDKNIENESKE